MRDFEKVEEPGSDILHVVEEKLKQTVPSHKRLLKARE